MNEKEFPTFTSSQKKLLVAVINFFVFFSFLYTCISLSDDILPFSRFSLLILFYFFKKKIRSFFKYLHSSILRIYDQFLVVLIYIPLAPWDGYLDHDSNILLIMPLTSLTKMIVILIVLLV